MSKVTDDISATLHAVGVNFGDHGETVLRAVEVAEDETVRALIERLIPGGGKYRHREYDHFVTLRFVEPAPVHDNLPTVDAPKPF